MGRTPKTAELRPADSVSQLLRHTHRALMRTLEARIGRHGIVISSWFLLRVLWEEDGLSQAELSDRVGIVGPTAVAAIRRLINDGLAVRRADPTDRRKARIFLTPAGRRLRRVLLPEAGAVLGLATSGLSAAEVEQLKQLLRRMALNLERFVPPAVLRELQERVAGDRSGRSDARRSR